MGRSATVPGRGAAALRSRIVLALTCGGLLICSAFALATYSLARDNLIDQRNRSVLAQAYLDATFLRGQLATLGTTSAEALAALSPEGATAVLVEREGRWASSLLDVGPDALPDDVRQQARDGHVAYAPTRASSGPALAVGIPLPTVNAIVYEVAPLAEVQAALRVLATVLAIGTGAGTVLAALVGLWARRRILQPLTPMATTAAAIAGGDLARRLPSTGDPDLITLVGSFNSMVDALHRRIERDARFASDVAHELRSPLTTLIASVELLEAKASSLPARSQKLLALVAVELERFRRLLDALLELARVDAGVDAVDLEPVDVPDLVSRAVRHSGRSDALLVVDPSGPSGEVGAVRGDRVRLERAVANLLDNADHHGGGVVRIEVGRRDGQVFVSVDDAGRGVPQGDRERIFERFATSGPRGSGSGTGLGLALVRETVRAHGGSTWCTEGPEGGARFVIRLPQEEV